MAHIRIVHFMVVVVVVLTIFLYSLLYTASPEMTTIIHAGTPHHYVMSRKDSNSNNNDNLNSLSNNNNLQNGDILVSNNLITSDRDSKGGGDVENTVPSIEKQSLTNNTRIFTRNGSTGVGSVVIRSENIVNTSATTYKSYNNGSLLSNTNVNSHGDASISPTLDAKSTAKTSDKSNAKSAINTTQISSTTTTTTAASSNVVQKINNTSNNNKQQQNNETVGKVVRTNEIYEPGFTDASPDLCKNNGEQLRLLILITSAPTHHEQRLAIRQSWGHYGTRRDVAIGFILGQTENQAHEDALAAEQYMYNDLVRGHFVDSYNNLTLKTISSLEWVDTYCPNASFFLKTDDDMFINIPRLLQFIEKHHNDKRTIYGRLAKKWKPIRNKKSKYYVSPQQYFPTIFPHFTTGPAYLITSDVIGDLYRKSLNQTYLKLEDVYTTGIVAQLLNIKRMHVTEFLNRRIAFNQCNIKKAISLHMIKPIEQFDLWKKLLDNSVKCK
uniref:Hexosyltransferase n=1 Tax=Culicoides sonorensis TaxID=179676 RepID=A0A336M0V7_CULSO